VCGRYSLNKTADFIAEHYNLASVPKDVKPNFNVAPTQVMPVITQDENGKQQLELMKWGIPRMLGKDLVKELINTRSDKAFGGFWKRTVLNHRCLVPATSFFEWKKTEDGKIPFLIHPKKLDLYAFAGIWSTWKNDDGKEIKTYSIMTTEPNKEMKAVHDRMPVILHPEDEEAWIEPSNDEPDSLGRLLFPFEDDGLEIYEVSRDVNSPRNNDSSLLKPVAA
jgi:putative SOS response-associated peptidase YedK